MRVRLLIAVFGALRLLGAQGPGGGYSAFTGNSQDIRVSDTARYATSL